MRWVIAGTHTLDSVVRVSTYHLVRHLARRGEQVLYLPAPISPLHFFLRGGDARFLERKEVWRDRLRTDDDGAREMVPLTLLPVLRKRFFDSSFALNLTLRATLPRLRDKIARAGFDRPDVLLLTNLQYAGLQQMLRPARLVYRCVDDIQGFDSAPRVLARAERALLRQCDFIFATSEDLADKLRHRGARDVQVIRHGVDAALFHSPAPGPQPESLAHIPRPRVIYLGTLSGWFAADWVEHAAQAMPECHFVLVGPREAGYSEPFHAGNIHELGPCAPDDVPRYLHACDAAIIPFRVTPLVESVLPVKLYEYLAAGLPVISARWRELERVGAPIALARSVEDFARSIKDAIEQPGDASERIAFANGNTWDAQFDRMIEMIRPDSAPRH